MKKTLLKADTAEAALRELEPVLKAALEKTRDIASPKDMETATIELSRLNQALDAITGEKEKVTKPLNAALKAERSRWKPSEDALEEAIARIRRKMTDYQTAALAKAELEAAAIADRAKPGRGNLSDGTAMRKIGEIDRPESRIETSAGKLRFEAVRCFEVMDVTMLSKEYILADEAKIRADMRKGIEVAGVRYYTEQRPINNR